MILSTDSKLSSVQLNTHSDSNKFEAKNSFFYTNDPFIIQLDEQQIYNFIIKKYIIFNKYESDQQLKKAFLEFLHDDLFVTTVLTKYNITIFELFEVFVSRIAHIFTKNFAQKVRDILVTKEYARKNT